MSTRPLFLVSFSFLLCLAAPLAASAQSCKTFSNCADAVKSFQSGNSKLDRDGDGIPCEKLCGKNGENMPGGVKK